MMALADHGDLGRCEAMRVVEKVDSHLGIRSIRAFVQVAATNATAEVTKTLKRRRDGD